MGGKQDHGPKGVTPDLGRRDPEVMPKTISKLLWTLSVASTAERLRSPPTVNTRKRRGKYSRSSPPKDPWISRWANIPLVMDVSDYPITLLDDNDGLPPTLL